MVTLWCSVIIIEMGRSVSSQKNQQQQKPKRNHSRGLCRCEYELMIPYVGMVSRACNK